MSAGAIDALRFEQSQALALLESLTPDEWAAPSGCAGWRVQDVVQHMASVFHTIADPTSIDGGSSNDAEENAEVPVQARRGWSTDDVIAEYHEWSARGIEALEALQAPPMADTVVPLANLGSHPLHLLGNAIVFDHYCHLRHDIGAAVARAADLPHHPASLRATLEWMLAGVPQMCATALASCSQGVNLVFADLDEAGYHLAPADPLWTVIEGLDPSLPTVATTAHDFVSWGTKRADWRANSQVADAGAAATLDAINVI